MLKSAKLGPEKLLVVLDEWAIVRPFQFCSQEPLEIIDKVHIKRSHRLQEGRYCIIDMLFSLFSLPPLDTNMYHVSLLSNSICHHCIPEVYC